ncbi:MAG: hypothetical protein P9X24_01935 [Candidatus Hatepunaea meridiana]|nr:hypothetical protein [Candidatus Hatepunaea meridiana]
MTKRYVNHVLINMQTIETNNLESSIAPAIMIEAIRGSTAEANLSFGGFFVNSAHQEQVDNSAAKSIEQGHDNKGVSTKGDLVEKNRIKKVNQCEEELPPQQKTVVGKHSFLVNQKENGVDIITDKNLNGSFPKQADSDNEELAKLNKMTSNSSQRESGKVIISEKSINLENVIENKRDSTDNLKKDSLIGVKVNSKITSNQVNEKQVSRKQEFSLDRKVSEKDENDNGNLNRYVLRQIINKTINTSNNKKYIEVISSPKVKSAAINGDFSKNFSTLQTDKYFTSNEDIFLVKKFILNSKQITISPLLETSPDMINRFPLSFNNLSGVSLTKMIHRITQIIYQSITKQYTQTNLKIDGGRLGPLQIQFTREISDKQITVVVETEAAREAVQKLVPVISENLVQKGVNLSSLEVQVGNHKHNKTKKDEQEELMGKDTPTQPEDEIINTDGLNIAVKDYGYNTIEILA